MKEGICTGGEGRVGESCVGMVGEGVAAFRVSGGVAALVG